MTKRIWACKIGEIDAEALPDGADYPIRLAVQKAYRELTGREAEFCFSGWSGELDEGEREVAARHMSART